MHEQNRIAVIIPTYRAFDSINAVIESIPDFIDHIIIVDDKCPQKSWKLVSQLTNAKITLVRHETNLGVGGAVKSGYAKALELECDICVKIDSDGQMDPAYMQMLITPIIHNKADYTKGNRFQDLKALQQMPRIRLIGNSMLSFLVKIASGYWNIMDPTNGYTAIQSSTIQRLDFEKIANRYFFESDMLINLNLINTVVQDVPIPARYGEEESSMSIKRVLMSFPQKLIKAFLRRLILKYFIYDFNMASIYTLTGVPMLLWGLLYGVWRWYLGAQYGLENSTGVIMLSVLPLLLGTQFIIAAINIDMQNIPKKDT